MMTMKEDAIHMHEMEVQKLEHGQLYQREQFQREVENFDMFGQLQSIFPARVS